MKKTILLTVISLVFLIGSQIKAQMPTVATDVSPLLVMEKIPDAKLINAKGKSVSLDSITKIKPTIIVFYRGAWCSNCTRNFKDEYVPNLAEIERLGYNLVAICPDAPDSLLVTSKKSGMDPKYFYGDGTGTFVKAMGLAWKQGENSRDRLLKYSGGQNTDLYLPVPAVYIVNTSNTILFAHIVPMGVSWTNRMKWWLLEPVLKTLKLYSL
jgi:peroxiredoxin